ncbi:hypothetical protein MNBD_GAMMA06-2016 [hydrothermal vent metagenome]|uniref:thioredoxin-dependent peroxiredoxin n=1 Tax=hydrothermal vent metagenome TaxID=652676 RepID=A0A3B0WVM4_9ZZZZ
MKKSSLVIIILAYAIFSIGCSISPVEPSTLDANKSYTDFKGVNAKVGEPAPVFSLPDADGKLISLQDFQNKKPVMLLFYRGEWCAYCMDQLDNYQALLPELEKHDIQLLAISPDPAAGLQNTKKRFGQSYIFLSDIDLNTTKKYGIGNAKDLPHPALFLIDKEGTLRWYYASTDFRIRPTAEQVEKIIQDVFSKK